MEIAEPDMVQNIMATLKIDNDHICAGSNDCQKMKVSRLVVSQECCRRAYIKGVFMTSGSISDPNKGYHMEIVSDNKGRAEFIQDIIWIWNIIQDHTEKKVQCGLSEGWRDDSGDARTYGRPYITNGHGEYPYKEGYQKYDKPQS